MKNFFVAFSILASCACYCQMLTVEALGLKPPKEMLCTEVKNQALSSTCWSFASLSLLEAEFLKQGKGELDLSEMFIVRYSLLRKIHRHLKLKGENYFTPGGQFHDVAWVIKNHGLVPESAYPGKPAGQPGHNHSDLDTILNRFIRKLVSDGVTGLNQEQEYYVNNVLDHYLGKVPLEFYYEGTLYTPMSLAERFLELKPDDYVEITSYTHHPFYTGFVLEDKYNWTGDVYYNVPLADFEQIADAALLNGSTLGWDGDAGDLGFDYAGGLAYLEDMAGDWQSHRQKAFESKETSLDHLMHIVGSSKDSAGAKWYYIKNSWGKSSNNLGGYLFMREDYFKIRTVAIIVNKSVIPPGIRQKLGI